MKYIVIILVISFYANAQRVNRGCFSEEFRDERTWNCTRSGSIPFSFSRVDGCRSKFKLNWDKYKKNMSDKNLSKEDKELCHQGMKNYLEIDRRCQSKGDYAYREATRIYSLEFYAQGWAYYAAGGMHAIENGESLETIKGTAELVYKKRRGEIFTKYYEKSFKLHCCGPGGCN